jgi:pyruvate kinase
MAGSGDPRRTKIVATIGPATASRDMLAKLIAAGMNGARLNFSHGGHEQHAEVARLVRELQEESGAPIALIADLQGPKLRIAGLDGTRTLVTGTECVVAGETAARDGDLAVAPAVIGEVLQPGHEVLIADGSIRLRVEEVEEGRARCAVLVGGVVAAHKGVNLPGVPVPIPSLTRKDVDDLEFALGLDVDFVALSFVRSAADVRDLRDLIEAAGSHAHVIAKIEKAEAVAALPEIVAETDALMVARGDLGVEIGVAEVPLLQKQIIQRALQGGKTVITATQMLESMVHDPSPSRAEASDIANAILDGTSALMLSEETAIGDYPIEAVSFMDRIARAVEPSLGYRHQLPDASEEPTVGQAMSNAACDLAEVLGARAVLVPTYSGRTASAVARLRPHRPIIALTHNPDALGHMVLEWGVYPFLIPQCADVEELWARSLEAARDSGLTVPGDRVVLTAGTTVNVPGSTNVIKVDTV